MKHPPRHWLGILPFAGWKPGCNTQALSGTRREADAALLDVALDYALKLLSDQGLFELGAVLKGGTSLRKVRVGCAGRFSTDLDFAAPDRATGELLLDTIDGAELFDVRFTLTDRETLRARLVVTTPLGQPQIPARIEISPRGLWLPTGVMAPIDLPVHAGYEFSNHCSSAPTKVVQRRGYSRGCSLTRAESAGCPVNARCGVTGLAKTAEAALTER